MPFTIYCHVNKFNGKRYVGQTKQTLLQRWKTHIYAAFNAKSKNSKYVFPCAIRKYGKDGWSHEVLEVCATIEEANLAEVKWILFHKTTDREFGYNTEAGGGSEGSRSEETRSKIAAALSAHYSAPENHAKLSHVMPPGMHKGRKLSDEHKEAIRAKLQDHYSAPENRAHLQSLAQNPTEEQRRKLGEATKRRYEENPELRLVSNPKGRIFPEEGKAKLRKAVSGRRRERGQFVAGKVQ